jgi:hypothetical protein
MAFSKARRLANLMSTTSDSVPASKVNTTIADDAITTAKIADDAITTALIADDAITTALIADDAVTADHLANSINSAITANTAKVTNAITTHTGDVTGGAALTIAVDAVDIPMLSATGSPSNTTFLRGDNAWAEVAAGVDIQSSAPSVASEGSLYYNTAQDVLYVSNGSAWISLSNQGPLSSGGTITIPAISGSATFSYNLGLNFTDDTDTDAQLTYTLQSGTLPAGCVLPSSGNSAFTGTATNQATATYNFVIRATDTSGSIALQSFTQTVNFFFIASGGTKTTSGAYTIHTFNSSGTFSGNGAKAVEYIVLAGGGGGGQGFYGGGGGAGGYRSSVSGEASGRGTSAETAFNYTSGNTTVTIGAGGAAGPANTSQVRGGTGSNSVLGSITSLGGGGGSKGYNDTLGGGNGGCGGASGCNDQNGTGTAGQGTAGQGYDGGSSLSYSGQYAGGGGGGTGGAGGNGPGGHPPGGTGLSSNITGSAVTRGGGGGGSAWPGSYGAGAGGAGGGGAGRGSHQQMSGGTGGTNLGGGGGGTGINGRAGGIGGSGVVIIRYIA